MPTEHLDLRDIHLPEPVSWWPPAIGYWMLLLLFVFLVLLAMGLRKRWLARERSAKIQALKELEQIRQEYQQSGNKRKLIEELSALLRRVSISLYPRSETASLTGDEWLKFLDKNSQDKGFTQGPGRVLATAPYQKEGKVDAEALIDLCRDWIKALP